MKYAVWAVTVVAVFLLGFAVGRIPSKSVPGARLTWATDPVTSEYVNTAAYVNRINQNMTKYSDAKVPFTIRVVQADDAVALPGGFFYVDSGLILVPEK